MHLDTSFLLFFFLIKVGQTIQIGSKRKRGADLDDVSRGVERARQFLKDFSELPLDSMKLEQALQHVGKLKEGLEKDAVNSSWLQQFLQ